MTTLCRPANHHLQQCANPSTSSQGTRASPQGRNACLLPAAAGRAVCDTLNTLGQAPCTATTTGTHDTPQVPGRTPGPTAAPLHMAQWAPNRGDRLHVSSITHMRTPPPKYKLGHNNLLSQVAHPLLLRSVLAANTRDARYNLLLQQLLSVLFTYKPIPSIIPLPVAEALSLADHSNPSPQSCPCSPRWLGQPHPSLSPQPAPSPSPSPRMATTKQLSFPGNGRMERKGNRTYWDRVLFFFKSIKRGEFLFDFPAALDRCLWETVPEA